MYRIRLDIPNSPIVAELSKELLSQPFTTITSRGKYEKILSPVSKTTMPRKGD